MPTASKNAVKNGTEAQLALREAKNYSRADLKSELAFKETLMTEKETIEQFSSRWVIKNCNKKNVMKQLRIVGQNDPNPFVTWVNTTKRSFFNAGFEIFSPVKPRPTELFLENNAEYPFDGLARDIWNEYLLQSNVVAFWVTRDRAKPKQMIGELPVVTILDGERVEYNNEFGVDSVKIQLAQRTLSKQEKAQLDPRYVKAIESGGLLELSEAAGERWKVLSTAKVGSGFGMPKWKAVMFDLAIYELLRIGDWNGAWARKKIMRHAKKGHKVTDGALSGMPEYFYTAAFGKKLLKVLQGISGFADFASNFDLEIDHIFLDAKFFDPQVWTQVIARLKEFAGPVALMLVNGIVPNPDLTTLFRAEGTEERKFVGKFIESILNDPDFAPEEGPRGMDRLEVRFDENVFYNEEAIRQATTFGLQNGVMPPQAARKALRVNPHEAKRQMTEAHAAPEEHTPVYQANTGNGGDAADKGNGGGDGGVKGGKGNKAVK